MICDFNSDQLLLHFYAEADCAKVKPIVFHECEALDAETVDHDEYAQEMPELLPELADETGHFFRDYCRVLSKCTPVLCMSRRDSEGQAATSSFEITFNHISIFGGARALFIAPDSNRELLKSKEIFGPLDNWTPHTTMLIDAPEVIFRAAPIVAEKFHAFQGMMESLHLYEF